MPVLVTFDFPPARGGIQRYIERLAGSLHELGHPVVVVAPDQPGSEPYDAGRSYPVVRFGGGNRAVQVVRAGAAMRKARRIAGDGFTLASSWLPAGFVAALAPRPVRGKLTVLAHGSELAPSSAARRALLRPVFGRAEHVVAVSGFTAGLLREAGLRREVIVVPGGVDARPSARARAAEPTVLSVGRLVARKGFDRVIEALPRLLPEFPALTYELVGGGPDLDRLRGLAEDLGVAGAVRFAGALSDDDLEVSYERAWCFAMPARNVDGDVEGFELVYLEAAVAGLPVVAGRSSGAVDAVAAGETGYLVDGSSTSEVASAIGGLLREPERAEAMGAAGRRRAIADFTWELNARRMATAMGMDAA